jgi:hypothetical protein
MTSQPISTRESARRQLSASSRRFRNAANHTPKSKCTVGTRDNRLGLGSKSIRNGWQRCHLLVPPRIGEGCASVQFSALFHKSVGFRTGRYLGLFRAVSRLLCRVYGGEGEIRTPDSLSTMPDFESGAFNRALPPLRSSAARSTSIRLSGLHPFGCADSSLMGISGCGK